MVYAIGYDGNKSESIMRGVEIVKVIPLVHYAAWIFFVGIFTFLI